MLYILALVSNISYASELGILGDNVIADLFEKYSISSNVTLENSAFFIMFVPVIYMMIKSSMNKTYEFEDEDRARKVRRKLIPYKIFIFITILQSSYLIISSKDRDIIFASMVLIIISFLIHYAKSCYLKSYIFDRKRQWLEDCNFGSDNKVDTLSDTKFWRYKIWINNIEKINFNYRIKGFICCIPLIIIFYVIFTHSGSIPFKLIMGYFLMYNLILALEYLFGFFTTTDGVCTGVYENKIRNSINYIIHVTDYKRKRELSIKMKETYGIDDLDAVIVSHGVITKNVITVNGIYEKINPKLTIIYYIITCSMFGSIVLTHLEELQSDISNDNDKNYINYEKNISTIRERLPIDEKKYKKVININKEEVYDDPTIEKGIEDIYIKVEKLYLNKKGSKITFKIKNNTDKGLVLNTSDIIKVYDKYGNGNSNILLPGEEYKCELDFFEKWKRNKASNFILDLEYTLSETVLNEYQDFSESNHYPLNVIENHCLIDVDLKNGDASIMIEGYDQYYKISNEVAKFKYIIK